MIAWLRRRFLHQKRPADPTLSARARAESDRDNWKLWKTRIPPTPRR